MMTTRPPAALLHRRHRRAARRTVDRKVSSNARLPVGHLISSMRAGLGPARVGDQDVEAPELLHRLGHGRAAGPRGREVAAQRHGTRRAIAFVIASAASRSRLGIAGRRPPSPHPSAASAAGRTPARCPAGPADQRALPSSPRSMGPLRSGRTPRAARRDRIVERRQVLGHARGDQVAVDDHRRVLVARAGELHVVADSLVAGGAAPAQQVRRDEDLRPVADGGDGRPPPGELAHEGQGRRRRGAAARAPGPRG